MPVLSTEELARQQAAVEDRVHHRNGVWWREVRPFFQQPCFLCQAIDPESQRPAWWRSLAGYTHVVQPGCESNGVFRLIMRDGIPSYSIGQLPPQRRQKIRSCLQELELRELDESMLLRDGLPVYASWHERVKWGRDKSDPGRFERWIRRACSQEKRLKLGAYRGEQMVAFALPFACESVISLSFIASHSDYLHLHPNDFLYHALLTIGRQTPGIDAVEFGVISSKPSLDTFKLGYGRVTEFPSFTWINPVLRPLVQRKIRRQYPWLQGAPQELQPAAI